MDIGHQLDSSPVTWPYIVFVMAGVVLISGCASVGSGSDAAAIQEATQRADERAATLHELVPEQTDVLIQLQHDRWEEATSRLELDDVPGIGRVDDAVERLDALDAVDATRPLVAAVTTTGNEDLVAHSWAHGWVTDREELAGGLHIRVIIPSHDASSLVADLGSLCEEDGAAPCRAQAHGEGFASVDVVVEAAEGEGEELLTELGSDGSSGVPWLERRTPALQAFLNTDAPIAVYWSGHQLLDVMTLYRSAVLRSVLETVGDSMSASHMAHALLQSHGSHLSTFMTDPDNREFEDFAVIADATESDGARGLHVDLVRTFTKEGHELWHGDDEGFDDVMARAETPAWIDDPVDGIDRWVVGLEMHHHTVGPGWLFPMLESPGAMLPLIAKSSQIQEWVQDRPSNLFFDKQPTHSSARWVARADSINGLETFQRWQLDPYIEPRVASYTRDLYEVTRFQLSDGQPSTEPPPSVGFDDEGFERVESSEDWRGCMGGERLSLPAWLVPLQWASPERRYEVLHERFDQVMEQMRRCADIFPDKGERFEQAVASSYGWLAHSQEVALNYHQARLTADLACQKGNERSCQRLEAMEVVDEFRMLPFWHNEMPIENWYEIHMAGRDEADLDVPTWFVTDRGVFNGEEGFEDGDELGHYLGGEGRVQLAVDAFSSAQRLVSVAEELSDHGVTPGVMMGSPTIFEAPELASEPDGGDTRGAVGIHLTTEGIFIYGVDGLMEPIDGCPDDGPTVCISSGEAAVDEAFSATSTLWADGKVEEAARGLDELLDRYRFYEVYNAVADQQQGSSPLHLEMSVGDQIPAVAAVRLLYALVYDREGRPFEDEAQRREAELKYEKDPEVQPRRLVGTFSLRSEDLSGDDSLLSDQDGVGRVADEDLDDHEDEVDADSEPWIDRDSIIISRVGRHNQHMVQHCYQARLDEEPELEGEVTVRFFIMLRGDVDRVELRESTMDDEELITCIKEQVRRWRFAEPEGRYLRQVYWPFYFPHGP